MVLSWFEKAKKYTIDLLQNSNRYYEIEIHAISINNTVSIINEWS